ncbi:hypothetical protein SH467x_001505 [Pirellulaceae bacterium SH467]|jgi:hypothetical protein
MNSHRFAEEVNDPDSIERNRIPVPKILIEHDHNSGRVHELLCHARNQLSEELDTWHRAHVSGEDDRSVEILERMLGYAKQIEADALVYELSTLGQLIRQVAASERIAQATARMQTELQGVLAELKRWEHRDRLEGLTADGERGQLGR